MRYVEREFLMAVLVMCVIGTVAHAEMKVECNSPDTAKRVAVISAMMERTTREWDGKGDIKRGLLPLEDFPNAIGGGFEMAMVSHSFWTSLDNAGRKNLVTGVLEFRACDEGYMFSPPPKEIRIQPMIYGRGAKTVAYWKPDTGVYVCRFSKYTGPNCREEAK